ncbi:MAG: adenylate/guanylate cyclase domain-containing protein [Phenylobacterium sp.]
MVVADVIDPGSAPAEALAAPGASVIDLQAWRAARRPPPAPIGLRVQKADRIPPGLAPTQALWAEQRRRRAIQRAFGQSASPNLVEQLVANPELLSLGGETRELTILFADIRGFTSLSETLKGDPQRLNGVINAVLGPLSDIVVAHGGTIDKYIGDCVMAFWGAPMADPHHAENAVAAAQAMLAAMDEINDALAATANDGAPLPRLEIGIGVNSGDCVVGNIGSERHFNYSALGDPVNIASRLVELSKTYGVHLLVGQSTAQLLPHGVGRRQVDCIAVRGRTECQGLFTLTASPVVHELSA